MPIPKFLAEILRQAAPARPSDYEILAEIARLMEKPRNWRKGRIYTHAGLFHGDDVYAVAAASLIWTPGEDSPWEEGLEVIRVNNPEDLKSKGISDKNSLVVDIGYGRFDHHQAEQVVYPGTSVRMSAVAKLWQYAGTAIVRLQAREGFPGAEADIKAAAQAVMEELILPLSDTDTRGQKARPNAISRRVYCRACLSSGSDEAFRACVDEARGHLRDLVRVALKEAAQRRQARELADAWAKAGHPAWGTQGEDFVPPQLFEKTAVKFLAGPSRRGGYNVCAVDADSYPIPADWPAAKKGVFWANYPTLPEAEKSAKDLAEHYQLTAQ